MFAPGCPPYAAIEVSVFLEGYETRNFAIIPAVSVDKTLARRAWRQAHKMNITGIRFKPISSSKRLRRLFGRKARRESKAQLIELTDRNENARNNVLLLGVESEDKLDARREIVVFAHYWLMNKTGESCASPACTAAPPVQQHLPSSEERPRAIRRPRDAC